MRTHWVHDKESLTNFFCEVFLDYKTDEEHIFVIHHSRNDFEKLLEFYQRNIKNKEWHMSFNGINFDAQITMHILKNKDKYKQMSGDEIAKDMYAKAQDCIKRSKNEEWQEYKEKDIPIKQLDLYTMNGWDGAQRRASLKKIQFSIDMHSIQEMPYNHTAVVDGREMIDTIVNYCRNDVYATKRILELSKEGANLRKSLSKEYDLPLYSAPEPKLAKEIFLKFLSEATGISKYDLKNSQTARKHIKIKEIILPYVRFKTKVFKDLLEVFENLTIDAENLKGSFKHTMHYKGAETVFGCGGLHGCTDPGIYESKEGMVIIDSDVTSFYPNLAIRNKLAPAHIPKKEFCELYEGFFEQRKKIPKKDPKNTAFKLILNSTVGLSQEKNSFLRDVQFFLQITMNGQLSLCMLYEMIMDEIPGAKPLMQNTDGITTVIPVNYQDKYMEICARWEKITNLQLEHANYKKLFLWDVNNYIAVPKTGKAKCKGRFEWEDYEKYATTHLHKDKSGLIIPKAIHAYFVNNIPPEKYLAENRNIFDYCMGKRIKGRWKFQQTCVIKGKIEFQDLQDTIRYYIAHKGCKIMKTNLDDGRQQQIEAGLWMQEIFNVYEERPWEEYGVNETYYLAEIYKEISKLVKKQNVKLTLF
jgi:hypothetical protein